MARYRNKITGQIIEVPDGPEPVPVGPQNPTYPYQGPQAAANLNKTQQDMSQDSQLFPIQKQAAEIQAQLAQMKLQEAQREAASHNPLDPMQAQAVKDDAANKLRTIGRIRQNYDNSYLPSVGFGAETMAGIGGTGAANIAADLDTLKAGGALTKVLELSQATGRNPFTPMSNSDVSLIANNIANLTQRQDAPNFFANLKNYQDAYTRAYAGANGIQTLNQEIERMLPTIPPAKREQFKADALRRYNQNMASGNPKYTGLRNAPRKSAGAKFLGFE